MTRLDLDSGLLTQAGTKAACVTCPNFDIIYLNAQYGVHQFDLLELSASSMTDGVAVHLSGSPNQLTKMSITGWGPVLVQVGCL